ncbi:MAG: carboxypeptidase regulatory-like domain-containing protein [Candidatus Wallbacteria bacterium]|nr:carboxypeptidase regulatory-like domain-containing protein [Candidatus Wallbacteria bacterium]
MGTAKRKVSVSSGVGFTGLVLVAVAVIVGCGGNAGVDDGTVTGKVFSNFSRGVAGRVPESGVTVVAQRESDPPQVIRTALTDSNGEYVLGELPVGAYVIGFAKDGFQTIDTRSGATAQRTAVGSQVRVFVEPGGVSQAAEVTLRRLAGVGNSTVVVTVLDGVTGQPVNDATVTVGTATSSNGGNNGVYTLEVPVNVNNPEAPFGQPNPERVIISSDGFATNQETFIVPIADQTVRVTISMRAEVAIITGIIRISAFEQLYSKPNIQIRVSNANLNPNPIIQQDGSFQITVPRSTSSLTRQFNIVFTHPGLETFTLSNVVSPVGGGRTLSQVVEMRPRTVTLVGNVIDSLGQAPNNLGPVADTATIPQTGQQSTIINGTYTIPNVPIGTDSGAAAGGITVSVRAFNPSRVNPGPPPRNGVEEQGEVPSFRPLTDTIFQLPLVITR